MTLNKLAAPFFILSLAAFGCSSSSNGGAAGSGGGSAGSDASAGTTGTDAAAGTTGTDAAAGTTGTDAAAGTTGTDAAAGTTGTDAATDKTSTDGGTDTLMSDSGTDAVAPVCSTTTDPGAAATPVLSASDFCHLFLSTAGCSDVTGFTIPTDVATEAACETNYAASTKQACRSYHLCGNAYNKATASKDSHCPHAAGGTTAAAGPCQE